MRIMKMSTKKFVVAMFAIGALVLTVAAVEKEEADDDEIKVSKSDVPKAVQGTLDTKAVGAADLVVTKEMDDEFTIYEAEFSSGGIKQSLKMTAEGAVVEAEQAVETSALPAAVLERLKKDAPKAHIKEAEQVTLSFYEVSLDLSGKEREIKIYSNGQLVEDED
jgi:vancomycin resistance protein YoaR